MEALPAVALLLGAIGSILAVYATVRGQRSHATESQLNLAWSMQSKQLDMLVSENTNLRERAMRCEEELVNVLKQLSTEKDGRRQLEIQVELLKLQAQRGPQ